MQLSTGPSFATLWLIGAGALGFITLCVGIYLYFDTKQFLNVAHAADGRIVDTRLKTAPNSVSGQSSSYLQVEFQTANQQTVRFESIVGTLGNARRIGQSVRVLYEPNNPRRAKIDSFLEVHGPWTIFLSTGALFVITVLAMIILR